MPRRGPPPKGHAAKRRRATAEPRPPAEGPILGIYRAGRILPTDRRNRADWAVAEQHAGDAAPGDLVLAEAVATARHAPPAARVLRRLGRGEGAGAVALTCIHAHGIPDRFPAAALAEASAAGPASAQAREDLRHLPLVTIDGEDARDFDDAVFAEPVGTGWRAVVAIADVAHYVAAGSALDREAWARGNSVYFPDRVVPMLPEALSNGWCSLKPAEDRACLFVELAVDRDGRKTSHRFGRGLMRSAAWLTYRSVQAARDGGTAVAVPAARLDGLYGVFGALLAARQARGALDLDLPERKITLDRHGRVTGVAPEPRLDSHRLIEELMVLANVAAAEELERLRQPCMYRVHDRPSDQKLEALRPVLAAMKLPLPAANRLHPRDFGRLVERARGRPEERLLNEVVLRAQSQAAYAPDNIGHFGLALPRYAHFTSPIRRYADLLVHRALIRGLKLGNEGLDDAEAARLPETAEHISNTERRAAQAERDANDRYLALFLADRVGEVFDARVAGVTRFGLFVALAENGAQGLLPLAALPDDLWLHDAAANHLRGKRSGRVFGLADALRVRLAAATPHTGSLVFALEAAPRPARRVTRRGSPA
jgi:ribonuclease R